MTDHGSLYQGWRDDPLGYWGRQASRIAWEAQGQPEDGAGRTQPGRA